MEINISKLFSFAATDKNYFKDNQDKIEIVRCIRNEIKCKEQLSLINQSYRESEEFRRNKDYPRSIEKLKTAFYKTTELRDNHCQRCTLFFQQTISDSVHEIRGELKKLTTGIFAKKYYEPSYNLASETIKDFENTSLKNAKNSEAKSKHKINRFMRKSAG